MYVKILDTNKTGAYPDTIGMIGKITNYWTNGYGVTFEGLTNPDSAIGVFWYKEYEFEPVDEIEIMEEDEMLESGYFVARVRFVNDVNSTKLYSYAIYTECPVDGVGRLAVTNLDKVVRIEDVFTVEDAKENGIMLPTAELKGIFDDSAYEERKAKAKARKELKSKMEDRVKQLERDAVYEMFAEKDAELKKLLDAYKAL